MEYSLRSWSLRVRAGVVLPMLLFLCVTDASALLRLFGRGGQEEESEVRGPERVWAQTFLDTVNAGKEFALSKKELEPLAAAVVPALPGSQSDQATAAASVFRIQCIASSQIETIREEKKRIESQVRYPVTIVHEHPFYKVMVGAFSTRDAAVDALAIVRGLGYRDAWVVESGGKEAR